jgi:hypothetical protein
MQHIQHHVAIADHRIPSLGKKAHQILNLLGALLAGILKETLQLRFRRLLCIQPQFIAARDCIADHLPQQVELHLG